MTDTPADPDLSDTVLHAIGRVAAYWSGVEAMMEFCILGHQEINYGTGMILTTNLGFHSKVELLQLFASSGDIQPKSEADILLNISRQLKPLYGKRNGVVHAVWIPEGNEHSARRMGVRTKGGKLRVVNEVVSAAEINGIAGEIRVLASEFSLFIDRNGYRPQSGGE